MPIYRLQLIGLNTGSGALDDYSTNGWSVDAPGVPDLAAVHAAFAAIGALPTAATSWRAMTASTWGTFAWEVRSAQGGPAAAYLEVSRVQGTAAGYPPQVTFPAQALVSRGGRTVRVGRLGWASIGASAPSTRPSTAMQNIMSNFLTLWHGRLITLGMAPVMVSDYGQTVEPIIGYTFGNSFGVLKSRKFELTQRTSTMV